jgi:hypothetical protein
MRVIKDFFGVSEEVIEIDKILEKMEIDKLLFHTQLHGCCRRNTHSTEFFLPLHFHQITKKREFSSRMKLCERERENVGEVFECNLHKNRIFLFCILFIVLI